MTPHTHAWRIIELLQQKPGLDDDEISKELGIEPRQTVNQVCNRLAKRNVIRRKRGASRKIVNSLVGKHRLSDSDMRDRPPHALAKGPRLRRAHGKSLGPKYLNRTLVVIPCCKAKQNHAGFAANGPSIIDDLPDYLAQELRQARNSVIEKAKIDETTLVPAWHRYDGVLYNQHGRRAVGELMQAGARVLILSGGYGLVHAVEPIGMYEAAMKLTWWPDEILQRCLIAYSKRHELTAVRAFASATTNYRKILERVNWHEAGIGDAKLLTPQITSGQRMSPATIGEALVALQNGTLATDWQSSDGLYLDVSEY